MSKSLGRISFNVPVSMYKAKKKQTPKKVQPTPAPPDPVADSASETSEDGHAEATTPVHTKSKKRRRKARA